MSPPAEAGHAETPSNWPSASTRRKADGQLASGLSKNSGGLPLWVMIVLPQSALRLPPTVTGGHESPFRSSELRLVAVVTPAPPKHLTLVPESTTILVCWGKYLWPVPSPQLSWRRAMPMGRPATVNEPPPLLPPQPRTPLRKSEIQRRPGVSTSLRDGLNRYATPVSLSSRTSHLDPCVLAVPPLATLETADKYSPLVTHFWHAALAGLRKVLTYRLGFRAERRLSSQNADLSNFRRTSTRSTACGN